MCKSKGLNYEEWVEALKHKGQWRVEVRQRCVASSAAAPMTRQSGMRRLRAAQLIVCLLPIAGVLSGSQMRVKREPVTRGRGCGTGAPAARAPDPGRHRVCLYVSVAM